MYWWHPTWAYCFVTGTSALTTAARITAVSPTNYLASALANGNINVSFSAPIDPLTVNRTTVHVSGRGKTAMPVSLSFSKLQPDGCGQSGGAAAGLDCHPPSWSGFRPAARRFGMCGPSSPAPPVATA
jgi:hypothetical protein